MSIILKEKQLDKLYQGKNVKGYEGYSMNSLENDFIALRNHIRKFNKKVNRKIKIKKVLDKLNISVSLQS